MTDLRWRNILALLDENERVLVDMAPQEPMPTAQFCRESTHRTLGHLTACQSAWLHIMVALRDDQPTATIPLRPYPLFRESGFATAKWEDLFAQFRRDRAEWKEILKLVPIDRETRTLTRTHTVQTITKRMAEHERNHLRDLCRTSV